LTVFSFIDRFIEWADLSLFGVLCPAINGVIRLVVLTQRNNKIGAYLYNNNYESSFDSQNFFFQSSQLAAQSISTKSVK